jgi:hypothetical protein
MSYSNSNRAYLALLEHVYEISAICSARTYIWGGFTLDIFEGKFTREHHDLDGFIDGMMPKLDKLRVMFEQRGYETSFRDDINMLTVRKGKQHGVFNAMERDGTVAMWRHIGNQGTVFFPFEWLDKAPRRFYDAEVFTSGAYFEYAFRQIAQYVNPEWKERKKDRTAKQYFEKRVRELGIEPDALLSKIWSYNPYWLKKGYDGFDKPTLVCPGYATTKSKGTNI